MATLKTKLGYGLSDISTSLFWKVTCVYIPIYYDQIYGLGFQRMGMVLFVSLMLSFVTDPLIGILTDRTQSKWGRYRPYLLWLAVPFCLCSIMVYSMPADDLGGKHIWAYFAYTLMMLCYTGIMVSHTSMLNLLTFDTQEKTRFASIRMIFAFGAGTIALAAWEPLCYFFSELTGSVASGWHTAWLVFVPFCLAGFLLCFKTTKEQLNVAPTPLKQDLKTIFHNFPWWLITIASFLYCLFTLTRSTCIAFYFNYYNGVNTYVDIGFTHLFIYTGFFLAIGEFFGMIGAALAPPIAAAMGKRNTYLLSNGIIVLLSILFCFLPLTDTGIILMMALQAIISVCAGIITPLLWSMYADVSTFTRWKNQSYCSGLIHSSAATARVLGFVAGGPLVLVVLEALGYASGDYIRTDNILEGLLLCMGGMSAFFAFAQLLFMHHFPLTPKRMRQIRDDLDNPKQPNVFDTFLITERNRAGKGEWAAEMARQYKENEAAKWKQSEAQPTEPKDAEKQDDSYLWGGGI